MKRASVFAFVLLVSTRAPASGQSESCAVSDECDAPLRCVDRRCVSLEPKPEWHPRTAGDGAMFGDGRRYTGAIIGADILALVGTTSLLLAAHGTDPSRRGGWQAAAMVPLVIGPVVHATRGRWLPAVISFLGWSSFGATVLTASLLTSSCTECGEPWLIAGATVLVIGGPLLTTLDAWMARDAPVQRQGASWFPVVAPTRSGALAGFGGVF